jgi:hypothetical protein
MICIRLKIWEKRTKMKKNKKSKSPGKAQSQPAEKVIKPDDDKKESKFGGLDLGNFKKNMGCGS